MNNAAIVIQACFRRYKHHGLLKTMMGRTKKYWAKLVINNKIDDVPVGPLTSRAIEDGRGDLVEKIWKRYPCENIGKTQHAAQKDFEMIQRKVKHKSKKNKKKYGQIASRVLAESKQSLPNNVLPLQKSTSSFYVSSIPEIKVDTGQTSEWNRKKGPLPPLIRTPTKKVIYNPQALLKANNKVYNTGPRAINRQMKKIKMALLKRKKKHAQRHDFFYTHGKVQRRLKTEKVVLDRLLSM